MTQKEKKSNITKLWFKDWANEYDNTLGKVKRHHLLLDLVVKKSNVKNCEKVLDIGIGTGLLSLKFLKAKDCQITGIDNSKEMLKICKEKINELKLTDKIQLKQMDAHNLDFPDNSFDIVASTVSLHHIKDKLPVIKKIYSILKQDGRFVLGDIDLDTTGSLLNIKRFERLFAYLHDELILALKDGGIDAFKRMYDNGKKHILNDGEYCISFQDWSKLCKKAGFKEISVTPLKKFERFKVLVAVKK
ncbi:MAG TPA: methyltransferase domain-containing protein [bacterium]|nr:methyltransferase domain-containing protein [bacterium]HOL48547.1 methyltransferase domain-containing protein [bacterium]HPQ19248.1 methyltransferase domain-containing protein [bacterium]